MKALCTALLAFASLSLVSCGGSFRADVTNPTVQQMDALDVQWGLSPRKPKGGVRTQSGADTPVTAAIPTGSDATAPVAAPRPASVDPTIIQSIR